MFPAAPWHVGDRFQAYSPDTDNATARRLYVQKHHAEPSRVIHTGGAILLGPIPMKG